MRERSRKRGMVILTAHSWEGHVVEQVELSLEDYY
jgi:hypothetical protein